MFAAPVAGASVSVPVGIVNKREGIQKNPTLTAKAGQAYPKKILLMN